MGARRACPQERGGVRLEPQPPPHPERTPAKRTRLGVKARAARPRPTSPAGARETHRKKTQKKRCQSGDGH